MFKKIKSVLLGVGAIAFGLILGINCLMAFFDQKIDYSETFQKLEAEGKVAEAINLGQWIEEHPDMPAAKQIIAASKALEEKHNSAFSRVKRFSRGFVKGEYISKEDSTGALASDLLFIGDIRDLGQQAMNKYHDEEVDTFTVALSTAGLASSLAVFMPEPTSTASGAAASTGLSLLKALKKAGALTKKFSRLIISATKNPRSLAPIVQGITSVAKRSPAGTLPGNMRRIETTQDLNHLKAGLTTDPKTATVLMSHSPDIKLNSLNSSRSELLSRAKYGVASVKKYSRPTKFVTTGNLVKFLRHFPALKYFLLFISLFFIGFGFYKIRTLR